jgi:predicted DNA-binding transcriptional regulator AlpA
MRNRTGNLNNARVPHRSGVGGLFAVPGLAELLADPEQIGVLDAHTRRALKTQVINALILLHNQDLDAASAETDAHRQRGDRLLDVNQAAEKFGVKADWLYRHHRDYGFTVRHGKLLRFSEIGIDDYIRKRRG